MSVRPNSLSKFKAPELYINEVNNNETVDVFALAGILYEMLILEAPFGNRNDTEEKIVASKRPENFQSDISNDLKKLIEKCWSQNPKSLWHIRMTFNYINIF